MSNAARYGDNIFNLGALVSNTLKASGASRADRDAAWKAITSAPSYDEAVAVCRRYITIEGSAP